MDYVSTRGAVQRHDFASVLLAGLAADGGLFVPATLDRLSPQVLERSAGMDYATLAGELLTLFAGDSLEASAIAGAVQRALARFDHPALAPINQIHDRRWMMELFHGPTLAFKDYALQFVGELVEHQLTHEARRATILCATSGDTGAAAAAAFAGRDNIDVVVLHPHGRVSPVQRRQMTTLTDDNVHNFAVDGDFDDCQAMVKQLFLDPDAVRLGLTAVNSINWARISAQVVYYAWSSLRLGGPAPVNYVVPTGNFGNILAADVARSLGFPVGTLVLSSNENDVLPRFFDSGHMQRRDTVATLSPSMDIQVSSNFERALWLAHGGDTEAVAALHRTLAAEGRYRVEGEVLRRLQRRYRAVRCDRTQAVAQMRTCAERTGHLVCPHTATALHAAEFLDLPGPTVVVGTAHAAKFPQAVQEALGEEPPLPPALAAVMQAPERYERIGADAAVLRDMLLERITPATQSR
jgi:threonine synthase